MKLMNLGDSAVSLVFEEKIDPVVNARCVAIGRALEARRRRGIRDIVPTYNAVTVHFDPIQIDRENLFAELSELAAMEADSKDAGASRVTIGVKYGGEFGPDLGAVAQFARCSEDAVIQLHSGKEYRVYMVGFLPGFPYMGSVDARIGMPRLESPRLSVPAGSVAIAGTQTGIYPCVTPGGWRIIGHTDERMFDPARDRPFLVKAGDYVKFVAL